MDVYYTPGGIAISAATRNSTAPPLTRDAHGAEQVYISLGKVFYMDTSERRTQVSKGHPRCASFRKCPTSALLHRA